MSNNLLTDESSILHLLNLDTVGGVEELFIQFLTSSPATRHHHVLVTGKKPHPFFHERLTRYAASVTQEKYFLGIKLPKQLSIQRRTQTCKRLNPQTIILWNRLEPVSFFRKTRAKTRAQVIYYEHGASWIEQASSHRKAYFADMDKVIANSHAARRLLQLKWGLCSPIHVIENPLKQNLRPADTPKTAIDLGKRALHLGYIGRLIPLKGACLVLHVVKLLKEQGIPTHCTIAGDGEDKQRLIQHAQHLGISSCVDFVGCIDAVEPFYRQIDLLLVPSIREPLGLVAQEAALLGCPVIASCVDGLPEVVINGTTGFCLPQTVPISQYAYFGGNSEKLPDLVYDPQLDQLREPRLIDPFLMAEYIKRLIETKGLYETMSQQAIEFAQTRPTIEEYTKALLCYIDTYDKPTVH